MDSNEPSGQTSSQPSHKKGDFVEAIGGSVEREGRFNKATGVKLKVVGITHSAIKKDELDKDWFEPFIEVELNRLF